MELKIPTPEQLETVYETHLKEAFPDAERKPLQAIEAMWQDGCYQPWCLFDGEEIAGECFLWLGRPGWVLLDYLCVSPQRRNCGIGAILLEKMQEQQTDLAILGECEDPSLAPDPAMAQRRLGFYARNRARMAGYDTSMFGVRYKTIYWAKTQIPDAELIEQHCFIYQSRFSPEKYAKYVRIPQDPDQPLMEQVPWEV